MFLTLTYDDALSPRMRGCFLRLTSNCHNAIAFPAYAGMFLEGADLPIKRNGFPRVCGDVSETIISIDVSHVLSPRMRGCFSQIGWCCQTWFAFPAYAGMFPQRAAHSRDFASFPRVCGDVSISHVLFAKIMTLSPRMRGCFLYHHNAQALKGAFPAYAGMFLELKP